jgi:hypothetical protein
VLIHSSRSNPRWFALESIRQLGTANSKPDMQTKHRTERGGAWLKSWPVSASNQKGIAGISNVKILP